MDWVYRLALLCALFLLSNTQTIPFSANTSSMVKELGKDDLLDILGTDVVYLVACYDPTDKDKTSFATTWEAVATEHQSLFSFGALDGSGPMKWMMDTFKVKKLPAVLAFPSRLTSSKPTPMLYKGILDQKNVGKWAVKQLPFLLVTKITSEPIFKTFKNTLDTPKVVIYHNDTEASPIVRALSLTFADRLVFGEVKIRSEKAAKLAEKEGITEFPKAVVYKKNDKVPYEGALTDIGELGKFLEPLALTMDEREAIRKERKEKREKEEQERKEKEAKDKAERDAKKKAEAAEKKKRRREKRKIIKARDEVYRQLEEEWQSEDGEYIQVRETGWDQIPDSMVTTSS